MTHLINSCFQIYAIIRKKISLQKQFLNSACTPKVDTGIWRYMCPSPQHCQERQKAQPESDVGASA